MRGLRDRKAVRYLATGAVLVLDVDPAGRAIRFEHPAAPWLSFAVAEAFGPLDYASLRSG